MVLNPRSIAIVIALGCLLSAGVYSQDASLHLASGTNDKARVELLLKAGANVNGTMPGGMTPLMLAAQSGHSEIVKILLDNKARVDQTDNKGNTALMIAVLSKRVNVVKQLVTRNADMNRKNGSGLSAMDIARLRGFTEIEDILKNNADPNG
ncbi:MAG: ankyrin repeat domain-containing protein [Acidobacteriota bacterium]|nr:ankyrin repeat domain-containing protein [Acidobacteriota bacterium]